LLFTNETGVNPGIRSQKALIQFELDVRKPLVVFISQKTEEPESLQPGQEVDNSKNRLENGIF
jgi:hypothetical protein